MEETCYDLSRPRRQFSRIGFALAVILAASTLVQWLLQFLTFQFPGFNAFLLDHSWAETLLGVIPMYFIAIPLGLLLLKKQTRKAPASFALRPIQFLEYIPISMAIMYGGNIIGIVLSFLFSGGTAVNPVQTYLEDNTIFKVLSVVVIAPIVEEYVFRKTIIDHSLPYGEKGAILLSAITFGLLHQNFFQFFYAAGLGLLLGYVYIRTGKLWYTILLHAIINFMGGVIAPLLAPVIALLEDPMSLDLAQILQILLVYAYSMTLMGLSVFGLVRLIIRCKRLQWTSGEEDLPKGTGLRTLFLNGGMILYTILCLAAMVASLYLT